MHYSKILLKNFRGFSASVPINLAPITFLVGPNSSGKSSIFDALLLISQSGFGPSSQAAQEPNWQGALVDLGSYKDTVYRHDIDKEITITTELSTSWKEGDPSVYGIKPPVGESCGRFEMRLACAGRSDPIGRLAELRVTDCATGATLAFFYFSDDPAKVTLEFLGKKRTSRIDAVPSGSYYFRRWVQQIVGEMMKEKTPIDKPALGNLLFFAATPVFQSFVARVQRIASGRLGPKRWYPVMSAKSTRTLRGLYDGIDPLMIEEVRPYSERQHLTRNRQRIASILKKLEIASAVKDVQLSPYHTSINVKDSVTKVVSNLIDVGYGASQVLPVILGCLSRSTSPLLVEQPEIHLHPRAQGTVAELLCLTSKQRQVIIETHSEHMVNHARILVAQGNLLPSDVLINYVKRDKDGSTVEPITILENGDFSRDWPEGFFDERYRDTMRLIDLKNKAAKRKVQ